MAFGKNKNSIDFNTLCVVTKDANELSTYFYKLSMSLEKMHSKGFYVYEMNPKEILYDVDNNNFILEVEKIYPDKREECIKSNIKDCAKLIENIDHYYNIDISKGYCENIRNNDVSYYYHDYIKNLERTTGNDKGNSKSMIKTTPAGVLFSSASDDGNNIDYSKAAFVSVPVMFIMAGVIIVIMIIIFCIMSF